MSDPIRDLTDDEVMRRLRDIDPVPPEVYAQARAVLSRRVPLAAHELRQGGFPVPALPGQTPGGVAVPDSTTLPGHQLPGARRAAGPGENAHPVQTALTGRDAGERGATVAGATRAGRGRPEPRNAAPAARLKLVGRYLAVVAAAALLAWLARFVGVFVGCLALLYLT